MNFRIFVLVPRIRGLEAVGEGIHFQHGTDDVAKRRFVDAWPLVDAVTGVITNSRPGGIPPQALVHRLDIHIGTLVALILVQRLVGKDVREERIVDLQEEPASAMALYSVRSAAPTALMNSSSVR